MVTDKRVSSSLANQKLLIKVQRVSVKLPADNNSNLRVGSPVSARDRFVSLFILFLIYFGIVSTQ